MSAHRLRGEPDEDFREGTALSAGLRTDFGPPRIIIEEGETELTAKPRFNFEYSKEERLAQVLRKKYDDQVVAVNVETGEELAVAEDTHKLTEMLLELEYNEEATMIVRCHGGDERGHPSPATEVQGPGPRP